MKEFTAKNSLKERKAKKERKKGTLFFLSSVAIPIFGVCPKDTPIHLKPIIGYKKSEAKYNQTFKGNVFEDEREKFEKRFLKRAIG